MSTIPGSQEDVVSSWEPVHSLVENAGLWGRDCSSPLLSGSGYLMPASLPQGPFGIHSGLCSVSGPGCVLEPLAGQFSLSFFFFWQSHSLGCYLMFALSGCPQGIQALSLL